jgi:Oxidoreductase molybdopterin binding domain
VKAVKGLDWGQAAIGNATWTGVRLRDVLIAAGVKDEMKGIEHVQVGQQHDKNNFCHLSNSLNSLRALIPIRR